MNLKDKSVETLVDDMVASAQDVALCRLGLALGIKVTSDGEDVLKRLNNNQQIVDMAIEELVRRSDEENSGAGIGATAQSLAIN